MISDMLTTATVPPSKGAPMVAGAEADSAATGFAGLLAALGTVMPADTTHNTKDSPHKPGMLIAGAAVAPVALPGTPPSRAAGPLPAAVAPAPDATAASVARPDDATPGATAPAAVAPIVTPPQPGAEDTPVTGGEPVAEDAPDIAGNKLIQAKTTPNKDRWTTAAPDKAIKPPVKRDAKASPSAGDNADAAMVATITIHPPPAPPQPATVPIGASDGSAAQAARPGVPAPTQPADGPHQAAPQLDQAAIPAKDATAPGLVIPDTAHSATAGAMTAIDPPKANRSADADLALPASGSLAAPVATSLAPAAEAAPGKAVAPTPATPPAQQMAPALVQLAHSPAGSQITLRLDPVELGHVQVQIDRAKDGTATVQVTVERPETLRLLMADQPQLHRTLDNAGVSQDGRSLTLSLATPDSGSSSAGMGGGAAGQSMADSQSGGQSGRQGRTPYASGGDDDQPATPKASQPSWLRAGVDITA